MYRIYNNKIEIMEINIYVKIMSMKNIYRYVIY